MDTRSSRNSEAHTIHRSARSVFPFRISLLVFLLAGGCGAPGEPTPPTPPVPVAIKDLAAQQVGDPVELTFTIPPRTEPTPPPPPPPTPLPTSPGPPGPNPPPAIRSRPSPNIACTAAKSIPPPSEPPQAICPKPNGNRRSACSVLLPARPIATPPLSSATLISTAFVQ